MTSVELVAKILDELVIVLYIKTGCQLLEIVGDDRSFAAVIELVAVVELVIVIELAVVVEPVAVVELVVVVVLFFVVGATLNIDLYDDMLFFYDIYN